MTNVPQDVECPARDRPVGDSACSLEHAGTLTVAEEILVRSIVAVVKNQFKWTEAEAMAESEAPIIAACVLRLLLVEVGQIRRAAELGTVRGLSQHLLRHSLSDSS